MFVCSVKYSAPNTISISEVLAPIGSSWETAWRAFELFFKLKTRKDWDMRFVKYDRGADAFVYTPPREGELRGMFWRCEGAGWIDAEAVVEGDERP